MNFKNIFIGGVLALLISFNGQASLTDGLLAHYPFDGNADDSSGNGKNATPYNNFGY